MSKKNNKYTDVLDPLTREFAERHPDVCARTTFSFGQKVYYILLFLLMLFLLKYRWDYFIFIISAFLMWCYTFAVGLRVFSALASCIGYGEDKVSEAELKALKDEDLPVYTILVPLYRESAIADKIMKRLARLDYPKDKLDVKLLLEADDDETSGALSAAGIPEYCEVIVVPDAKPKTKPRACNYGLRSAKGEFCVIYDAEDIPEPDQLKKALVVFRRDATGKLLCVQAKLNYYNSRQNWLTRFFTIEYSTNFDILLGGFHIFKLPLPLGGTSNHFRTLPLQRVGGWDPFNVTEDCDLGIRIYEYGYHTTLLDSTTWEEANSNLWNWLRQRSRWVKGFMQTHLAHFRNPLRTVKRLTLWGAAGCYLTVGGSVLMMLTNLIFWPLILFYFILLVHALSAGVPLASLIVGPSDFGAAYQGIRIGHLHIYAWPLVYSGPTESLLWSSLSKVFFAGSIFLFLSNFLLVMINAAACVRRGFYHLLPLVPFMPFYWFLISLGAWKGFWQLLSNPFYWEKTKHGLDSGFDVEHTINGKGKANAEV